ncbi:MAG: hypothetical protein QOH63_3557 [Acidobacteriota bacterium]|jgi:hypothetical protein|nr:hypothetical protein [Acidobacteriota bacterium]
MAEENEQKKIHRRRVTLADGRYLIFYTFDEQLNSGRKVEGAGKGAPSRSEPDAQPQAEEERRV